MDTHAKLTCLSVVLNLQIIQLTLLNNIKLPYLTKRCESLVEDAHIWLIFAYEPILVCTSMERKGRRHEPTSLRALSRPGWGRERSVLMLLQCQAVPFSGRTDHGTTRTISRPPNSMLWQSAYVIYETFHEDFILNESSKLKFGSRAYFCAYLWESENRCSACVGQREGSVKYMCSRFFKEGRQFLPINMTLSVALDLFSTWKRSRV